MLSAERALCAAGLRRAAASPQALLLVHHSPFLSNGAALSSAFSSRSLFCYNVDFHPPWCLLPANCWEGTPEVSPEDWGKRTVGNYKRKGGRVCVFHSSLILRPLTCNIWHLLINGSVSLKIQVEQWDSPEASQDKAFSALLLLTLTYMFRIKCVLNH